MISLTYIFLIVLVVNCIPIAEPSTGLILILYEVNYPSTNFIWLSFIAIVAAVIGKSIMYFYSKIVSKYLPKRVQKNVKYLNTLTTANKEKIFIATFLYSVTPAAPTSVVFLSGGLIGGCYFPVTLGFGTGEFIDLLAFTLFASKVLVLSKNIGISTLEVSIASVALILILILIDWEKVLGKNLKLKYFLYKIGGRTIKDSPQNMN